MPSRPMPQSDDSTRRSAGMCFSASRMWSRDLFGRLDLQRVVVDDADRDLHVGDLPADASRSMPPELHDSNVITSASTLFSSFSAGL